MDSEVNPRELEGSARSDAKCEAFVITNTHTHVPGSVSAAFSPRPTCHVPARPSTVYRVALRRCSPETLNTLDFPAANDVWALGVTLWELAVTTKHCSEQPFANKKANPVPSERLQPQNAFVIHHDERGDLVM